MPGVASSSGTTESTGGGAHAAMRSARMGACVVAIVGVLGAARPAGAAISFVGTVCSAHTSATGTGLSCQPTGSVAGGSVVVLSIVWTSNGGAVSASDDGTPAGTYSCVQKTDGGTNSLRDVVCVRQAGGPLTAANTITLTGPSSGPRALAAFAFAGVQTSGAVVGSNSGTSSGQVVLSGSVVTPAGEVLEFGSFAARQDIAATSFTAGSRCSVNSGTVCTVNANCSAGEFCAAFTGLTRDGTTGQSYNRTVNSEYRISPNGPEALQATGTLDVDKAYVAQLLVLPAVPSPTPTPTTSLTPTTTRTPTPTQSAAPTNTFTATTSPTATGTATATATPTTALCTTTGLSNPCVPGGGIQSTDCYLEWAPQPVPTRRANQIPKATLICWEGDPACDIDGVVGNHSCTMQTRLCINNADPRLSCVPADVAKFQVLNPAPSSTDAANQTNLQTLEAGGGAGFGVSVYRGTTPIFLGPPNTGAGTCSALLPMVVPQRVVGTKIYRGQRVLRVKVTTSQGQADTDALTLQCRTSTCGDGKIQSDHEQCDQGGGNRSNGDGCDAGCHVEPGWQCSGLPSVCVQLTPTPTSTGAAATSTPTTSRTMTPSVTATVPGATASPTNTVPPTATNTPGAATATPTVTATPSVTATAAGLSCGGISVPASNCCNHQIDAGETCDDGGTCSGGSNSGNACTANSDCAGGECLAFGGDGCAANCTTEKIVPFVFTGARCFGGAKNGQACTFTRTCASGTLQGKPCSVSLDCGSGVSCVSECATGTDGSDCEGVGVCTAGDANKIGTLLCPSSTSSKVPPTVVKLCQGGTKAGIPCTASATCSGGGSCVNPCSPAATTGLCTHQSGAVLQSVFLGPLGIGPFTGQQELRIGAPDPSTQIMPVSVKASSVHFDPVKIPGLACACPRGVVNAAVHGPGNSQSGFIGCGASGLLDPNVDLSIDHNTSPGSPLNGMGTCSGGGRAGLACGQDSDCGGGTCLGTGGGGGVCVAGANAGKVCHLDADCPSSICNSPDDTTGNCTLQDPGPPAGSGSAACLETKTICFGGTHPGTACTQDSDCGATPATCGTVCNPISLHPGTCNSPAHLSRGGGASQAGTGLIVTTTAIGVIGPPNDTGTCQKDAYCLPMAFGASPTTCQINAECSGGTTCRTAFCGGICNVGPTVGQSCASDADCNNSAGSCTAGANFGVACTGTVAGECGASNICRAVDPAKGFDGLPCTDDDPLTSQGTAQTIASTTTTASASIVDLSDNTNGGTSFGMLDGTVCSGFTSCTTAVKGTPFDCSASTGLLAPTPSAHGAGLASAFPQLDSASTGDNVVTNRQTAR